MAAELLSTSMYSPASSKIQYGCKEPYADGKKNRMPCKAGHKSKGKKSESEKGSSKLKNSQLHDAYMVVKSPVENLFCFDGFFFFSHIKIWT